MGPCGGTNKCGTRRHCPISDAHTMLPLIPGVQSYDWGKPGSSKDCLVADFAAATPQLGFRRDAEKPCAELWMGTHPNVPSHVADGEKPTLHSVLMSHPELLGDGIVRHFGLDPKRGALPFLFKVLSINKALSIQAHPDKELAERLNAEKPSMYKGPLVLDTLTQTPTISQKWRLL